VILFAPPNGMKKNIELTVEEELEFFKLKSQFINNFNIKKRKKKRFLCLLKKIIDFYELKSL